MTIRFVSRFLAAGLVGIVASAGVTSGWQVRVNGRPGSDGDNASSVAVDPATGSIFVAGSRQISANDGFFLEKLSFDGRKEWRETVTGTANGGFGRAAAVTIDTTGHVFVAGFVANVSTEADFVVMKLDGRSQRKRVIWKRVVDGLGFDDGATAIALTPDGGVVLAGFTSESDNSLDMYVMKFDGSGHDAWPSPQIIRGTGFADVVGIAVLSNGDVAVGSALNSSKSGASSILVRLAGTTGAQRWSVIAPKTVFTALTLAANGDILIGASIDIGRAGPGLNAAVFRFSETGALVWQTDLGDEGSVETIAAAPNGGVLAGGGDRDPSQLWVVDLSADGVERWQYRSGQRAGSLSLGLEARGISFDRFGNPIVAGTTTESDRAVTTFSVIALNKDTGNVIWDVPIVGDAGLANEGQGLARDSTTGAIVAVGAIQNVRSANDIAVSSICDGVENWRRVINGPGERINRYDGGLALATDPNGASVALAGYAQTNAVGPGGEPRNFRVVKIKNNGRVAWVYDLLDPVMPFSEASTLTIDSNGRVFAAGRISASRQFTDALTTVVALSKGGTELWRRVVPGDGARQMVRDPRDGNVIVSATLPVPGRGGRFLALMKLDAVDGTILWLSEPSNVQFGGLELTLTSRNTVAVASYLTDQAGPAVAEFDTATGAMASSGNISFMEAISSMAYDDGDGTVVVGGRRHVSEIVIDAVVAKVAGDGTVVWARDVGQSSETVTAVAVRPETGDIAVGASFAALLGRDGSERWRRDDIPGLTLTNVAFAGESMAGGGVLVDSQTSNGLAIVAFGPDGSEQWRRVFSAPWNNPNDRVTSLAVTHKKKAQSIYAAGILDNGATALDMFAVGLDADGSDLTGRRR